MTSLASGITLATTASLIGDVARANILCALSGGQALTAGELAFHAGVGASTTSGHLAKLTEAGLITTLKQGRHRYYRLSGPKVAAVIETLMSASDLTPARHRPAGPRDAALRRARSCYDHMAGGFAVELAERLEQRGFVILSDEGGYVTETGSAFFTARAEARRIGNAPAALPLLPRLERATLPHRRTLGNGIIFPCARRKMGRARSGKSRFAGDARRRNGGGGRAVPLLGGRDSDRLKSAIQSVSLKP